MGCHEDSQTLAAADVAFVLGFFCHVLDPKSGIIENGELKATAKVFKYKKAAFLTEKCYCVESLA